MVKGNWERRAELASVRRTEEKLKKHKVKTVNAESVVTKLLRDDYKLSESSIVLAWLTKESLVTVCSNWLRNEDCIRKKCKLNHDDVTLADVRGIDVAEDTNTLELAVNFPVLITSLLSKDFKRIRFIAIDGECVFDAQFPEVWQRWELSKLHNLKELSKTEELLSKETGDIIGTPVTEEIFKTDDLLDFSEKVSIDGFGMKAMFRVTTGKKATENQTLVENLASFLDTKDMIRLVQCNKEVNHFSLSNFYIRNRRKEGQASVANQLSKMKKREKKVKTKQANLKKKDKKDSFARGGNCG